MHIGLITLHLGLGDIHSLKDKRHIVHSLLGRIRSRFPVSAAEVGDQNLRRQSVLAAVMVSGDAALVHMVLQQIANFVEDDGRAVLDDTTIEML
ncbi:MAG: DUF503 domain-containing protein [Armatimonadota bacterium]